METNNLQNHLSNVGTQGTGKISLPALRGPGPREALPLTFAHGEDFQDFGMDWSLQVCEIDHRE